VEISTDEGWLIDRVGVVTESAQLAEHYGDDRERGSFCISLSNGPLNITISSYCVDPADLDLIGKAAMAGAVACLVSIDPDMDGDMDVPGADAEDTDGDMGETASAQEVAPNASGPTEAEHHPDSAVAEASPAPGAPDAGDQPAPDTSTAAPDPAADPHTETEEPVVTEPTTQAVESAPAAEATPAAAAPITLSADQFEALLGRLQPATPTAPAAPAAAAAAPAEAAPAATAAVTETEDERIARIVEARFEARMATERTRIIQDVVESGRGPGRRGLVNERSTHLEESDGNDGVLPEGWPDKPLHKYSGEERQRFFAPQLEQYVLGSRANVPPQQP
jgi:hypothetical protein